MKDIKDITLDAILSIEPCERYTTTRVQELLNKLAITCPNGLTLTGLVELNIPYIDILYVLTSKLFLTPLQQEETMLVFAKFCTHLYPPQHKLLMLTVLSAKRNYLHNKTEEHREQVAVARMDLYDSLLSTLYDSTIRTVLCNSSVMTDERLHSELVYLIILVVDVFVPDSIPLVGTKFKERQPVYIRMIEHLLSIIHSTTNQ